MKSVKIEQNHVEVVDVPEPKPAENFVKVKVLVAPMCSEYRGYRGYKPVTSHGHEASGEVVEIAQAGRLRAGDRVVMMPQYPCGKCSLCIAGDYVHCEHLVDPLKITGSTTGTAAFAQYIIKQDWLLLPVPEDVSLEHASMACCGLGPTFGAMEIMDTSAFHTVLIGGLGPVGLGGVINAVYRGARVIGVARNQYRSHLARELGADTVVDPEDPDAVKKIRDLTGGVGADCAIDTAGFPMYQRLLIDATRRKGHVSFVGMAKELTVHVWNDLIAKGLHLHGAWHFNLVDVEKMFQLIRRTGTQLDRLITHRFPIDKVREAFELQDSGQSGKVLLQPWA